jgi:hypothetical protein
MGVVVDTTGREYWQALLAGLPQFVGKSGRTR